MYIEFGVGSDESCALWLSHTLDLFVALLGWNGTVTWYHGVALGQFGLIHLVHFIWFLAC